MWKFVFFYNTVKTLADHECITVIYYIFLLFCNNDKFNYSLDKFNLEKLHENKMERVGYRSNILSEVSS